MEPNAIKSGSINNIGATIITSKLNTQSSCGGVCQSGHMEFNTPLLHTNITVISRWYPPINNCDTSTGEGFIDMETNGNNGAITFGFHGDDNEWPYVMTTNSYKNISKYGHKEIIINTSNINLALDFNKFQIIWTKDYIEWILNDETVRTETNKSYIPNESMIFRLHDRSQNCPEMEINNTFFAQFTYFQCVL